MSVVAQQVQGGVFNLLTARESNRESIQKQNRELQREKMSKLIQKDIYQLRQKMIEKQAYKSATSSQLTMRAAERSQYSTEKPRGKPGARLYEMAKKRSEDKQSAIELAKQQEERLYASMCSFHP